MHEEAPRKTEIMSPRDGALAAPRCPEEPQEGFLEEVAELVLTDEEESCEGSRWEESSGQRGPSHEGVEVGRLGGPSGRSRAGQSSWHSWSKVCEVRRDEGGAGAQPHCRGPLRTGSDALLPVRPQGEWAQSSTWKGPSG